MVMLLGGELVSCKHSNLLREDMPSMKIQK